MIENVLKPLVNEQTRVLVVGSMPGKQSLEKQQYYGHPRNHFWPIMNELFGDCPDSYRERLAWLQSHGVGLWDAIAYCEREGSLDAAIRNEVPNDFRALFEAYPQIECVLFNGGKAKQVFKKHLGFDVLAGRDYAQMPSTSPIPGKNIKSFEDKVAAWSIIRTYTT